MKKIFLFLLIVIFVAAGYLSTYGWKSTKSSVLIYSSKTKKIAASLKKHISVLSQEIGWRNADEYGNLQKAGEYIYNEFLMSGFEVEKQEFKAKDKVFYNIIAKKKGSRDTKDIFVVGAHYDTYFSPGADANASGAAVLLELAKSLSLEQLPVGLQLVAFTNKEPPFWNTGFMGSAQYLNALDDNKQGIVGAVILDSVGYYDNKAYSQRYPPFFGIFNPDKGNFLAVVGNRFSAAMQKDIFSRLQKKLSFSVIGFLFFDFINSDHWAFWERDYPAVLLTDTGPYRSRRHAGLKDVPERLNYLKMAQIVEGLVSVILDR